MENSIEFFLNTHLEWSLSCQDLVITRSVSIGSSTLVLLSFTTNTLNLFRESDQGVLFASYSIQNPPLSEAPLFWKGNPLIPANLLLVLSTALLSTILCPGGGGSLSQMATYLICN